MEQDWAVLVGLVGVAGRDHGVELASVYGKAHVLEKRFRRLGSAQLLEIIPIWTASLNFIILVNGLSVFDKGLGNALDALFEFLISFPKGSLRIVDHE